MIKEKKGLSHVEMVISFAIFISFVVFMLVFFKPLKIPSRSSTLLETTEAKILENVSTELNVFSVKITNPSVPPPTCFSLASSINKNIIVKDGNEERVNAKHDNTNVYFAKSAAAAEQFYRVYYSDEFVESVFDASTCNALQNTDNLAQNYYVLGVTRAYKKVSLAKLKAFFDEYNDNNKYAQLKINLGLGNNFNVYVRDSKGNIIQDDTNKEFKGENYKPSGVEIMAKEIPIEILNEKGEIMPAVMNIQVF